MKEEEPAAVDYSLQPYSLVGPQVEPEAGYWTYAGKRIEVVQVDGIPDDTIEPFDKSRGALEADLLELSYLAANRANPQLIAGDFPDGTGQRARRKLSDYFFLRPHPISAIINLRRDQPDVTSLRGQCDPHPNNPLVTTGEELARLFEAETPGLLHRHALNCILFERPVSPPRQARVWMALDITIYSALLAAWHFKWANRIDGVRPPRPDFDRSYIERPYTYEARIAEAEGRQPRFQVLYDFPPRDQGDGFEAQRRCPEPFPSPGTPRHPAYTSGHSTYSAAASHILKYFFPDQAEALDDLADNIGVARLWAGVHWRQDHENGRRLGIAVAERVIRQLERDPVPPLVDENGAPLPMPNPCDATVMAPEFWPLHYKATQRRDGPSAPNQDVIPPMRPMPVSALSPSGGAPLSGPNRGAVDPQVGGNEGEPRAETE
ncbi:MAG TPA: hypothetical protein VGB79_10425 [Allosphingosinicella sp.]